MGSSTDSEETPQVRHIAPCPAIAIGTGSVQEVEVLEPPLFVPPTSSSCRPCLSLTDTLEGARDEDIAATLRESPQFENILVQESAPSHVQDIEQDERQREAEVAAGEERVTIVREVELALELRAPFTPATYVPRVHFFVSLGCDTYILLLPSYSDTATLRDVSTHIAFKNPLACISPCFLLAIVYYSFPFLYRD